MVSVSTLEEAATGYVRNATMSDDVPEHIKTQLRNVCDLITSATESMYPGNNDQIDESDMQALSNAKRILKQLDNADSWSRDGVYDYYAFIYEGHDEYGRRCSIYSRADTRNAVGAVEKLKQKAGELFARDVPQDGLI